MGEKPLIPPVGTEKRRGRPPKDIVRTHISISRRADRLIRATAKISQRNYSQQVEYLVLLADLKP